MNSDMYDNAMLYLRGSKFKMRKIALRDQDEQVLIIRIYDKPSDRDEYDKPLDQGDDECDSDEYDSDQCDDENGKKITSMIIEELSSKTSGELELPITTKMISIIPRLSEELSFRQNDRSPKFYIYAKGLEILKVSGDPEMKVNFMDDNENFSIIMEYEDTTIEIFCGSADKLDTMKIEHFEEIVIM